MKSFKKLYKGIVLLLPVLLLLGCSKDFLNRPPKDSIVDGSFYKTDAEVMAATSLLYSQVWFDYNDKAYYNLGDFRGGSAYDPWSDRGNVMFNTTADNGENGNSWRAFFTVVAQSNLAIQNINRYAGAGVSPGIKKYAIAEARFMRSLAYRYIVMNWGDVPIITNNQAILTDTTIQKNTSKSVWRFVVNEMLAAAKDLPETPYATGKLTKWSAEGMLARFYLSLAGVESSGGVRNQVFLDSAKYYAERVITLSDRTLLKDYASLFLYPYDNNSESLFELEWVYTPTAWGTQNSMPAYLNFSNDIANGDGWGGAKSATWWILKQYEGINVYGSGAEDTLKGRTSDTRLKATYMLPGAVYPEITQSITLPNGTQGEQRLVFPNNTAQNSFANIKKYVVGKAKDVGGQAASQHYPNDTYMMRLAEIYLIYAEAALGNSNSTTDPKAFAYFNKVHERAGLPAITAAQTGPLTFDMIFKERMVEFAMESMCWYDFVNLHYWNPEKAFAILNAQDRGMFAIFPDQFPNPTQWTFVKTPWVATADRIIHAYEGNFLLPIPAAELSQAPNLKKPAVDYYTK